jgi:hypothetical protein
MQFRKAQVDLSDGFKQLESNGGPIEIDRGVVVNRRWVFGAGAAIASRLDENP